MSNNRAEENMNSVHVSVKQVFFAVPFYDCIKSSNQIITLSIRVYSALAIAH